MDSTEETIETNETLVLLVIDSVSTEINFFMLKNICDGWGERESLPNQEFNKGNYRGKC